MLAMAEVNRRLANEDPGFKDVEDAKSWRSLCGFSGPASPTTLDPLVRLHDE
jgi:hypothetical protein